MKRIKMGGLNVLLLFAHNAPSEQHTSTRGVIWYVQSYLILHLHAKSDWQRINKRQEHKHGNNHCPDLLKIKTIQVLRKNPQTPKLVNKVCSLCAPHRVYDLD